MSELFDKLVSYGESDYYPCHMPGHKRRLYGAFPGEILKMDITEIDGFDNLHDAVDLLKRAQEKAAMLYGAKESFYLVNGSTCGILSAVSAAVPANGHILMARNCHKSAYHAAYLRGLNITYLFPQFIDDTSVYEAIDASKISQALDDEPDIDAVFLVSPTYEGRIADIETIARLVHERGKILIVDEAHGAHLGLAEGFSKSSVALGADLVIQSVHKTLAAPTQTALLHLCSDRVDRGRLTRFLHIYQTSSPSYLLMSGIENALEIIEKDGSRLFGLFADRYNRLIEQLSVCKKLRFLKPELQKQDIGKLVVDTRYCDLNGRELYDRLLEQYHIQPEMAAEEFVLLMFTIGDTEEGYARVKEALLEIDASCGSCKERDNFTDIHMSGIVADSLQQKESIPLAKAWDMERCPVKLSESVGAAVAEFVNLYPPGVPVLVPGERMTETIKNTIYGYLEQGLSVQGLEKSDSEVMILCLKEE